MSMPAADTGSPASLRQQAQQRLAAGTAPVTNSRGVGVEALALLHRLASTPASAPDALKLLHELQVHQVELDLQQVQIEANEHDLAGELAHYRALYEHAPVAQFVLDDDGRIAACNRHGAELLGVGAGDAAGRSFDEFLAPDDRLSFVALLRGVRAGTTRAGCSVRPGRAAADAGRWRIAATVAAGVVQLVVTDDAGSPAG